MADFSLSSPEAVEAETKYCPADWLDEVVPVLVADPADCVYPGGPTGWLMLDEEANRDEDPHFCRLPVETGQVVGFCAHRNYGTFELTVHDDRTFEIDPYPADATHFAHEDAEWCDMYDTVTKLVERGDPQSVVGDQLEPGTHQVRIWFWSDEIPFRFEVEDGKPKFVRCAGAQ
ncbi:hypothetical protein ABIA24_001761 [Sinorhizobium fredii]|uniref:hypothetical protein n=1 Tax=Rhizobium fredii TaxID=380 RepID=UPI00351569A7